MQTDVTENNTPSILSDTKPLRFLSEPLHQGFWIDIVRIQRAKRLLVETREPVIDIAASVGVEDQSYFSRLFKKETGLTPSAFRKKMQG